MIRTAAVVTFFLSLVVLPTTAAAAATAWTTNMSASTHQGEAHSTTKPPATSSLTAACQNSTSEVAVVSWSAVTNATSYKVEQATTSSGTYSAAGTQPSGTALTDSITYTTNVTYYYKLYAYIGTNWQGTLSANAKVGSTTPGFLVFQTSGTMCTAN
ncbi:MAG: hypothetical protein ABSC00_06100 [Acidimicrobiales bacterium]